MAEKTSKGKETFLKNREMHFEFRSYYTPTQIKQLDVLNVCFFIYGLLGRFILAKFVYAERTHFAMEFTMLIILSTLLQIGVSLCKRLKMSERRRDGWFECLSMFAALGYILWGYNILVVSIMERRTPEYLPILMIYAIVICFYHYSLQHYLVFFFICAALEIYVVNHFDNSLFESSIIINIALFGIIMTAAGIARYYMGQKKYFVDKKAQQLHDDLEANYEEMEAVNQELTEATEALRKQNEAQKLFTAGMSHELRSPLNGIIGLLQVLEDDKNLNTEEKENVDKALSSSVTLINIVNDLLDFYKLEAGEFNMVYSQFDLREVIENVKNANVQMAESRGLDLIFDIPGKMPCMYLSDGLRIQQVLVNIVSNGIKYTDEGFVKTTCGYENGILTMSVQDSGQGIAKEAQESLFDPFKRLNENKNRYIQGTGLGLSIVKKLVEQLKGEITLDSEVGKGSTFTIRIPVQVTDMHVKFEDKLEAKESEVKTPDLTGKKFLCVDDNKVNLAVFKGLFKNTNAELKLLPGGKECLEEITKEKYDIIFLDHLMPQMDGVETFENMQKIEHLNKETPVVMLTANAGAEAEQRYMDQGFNGYLSKPVLRAQLYELTNKLLG